MNREPVEQTLADIADFLNLQGVPFAVIGGIAVAVRGESRFTADVDIVLGIDLEHLGVVFRDDMQNVALGSRLPIVRYKPNSILSQGVYRIADKLVQMDEQADSPLDFQSVEATYQEAGMEAEVDFNSKLEYLEDLLQSGALSMGDLVETVKSQQFEISQLKKENQLLKTKLVRAAREGFTI